MTIHQKRKNFIQKFITVNKGDYGRQMMYAKEIFKDFNHDFLAKLTPPNWWKKDSDSLYWFITQDGKNWMKLKQSEFFFKIENDIIKIDDSIENENVSVETKTTLRQFLKT